MGNGKLGALASVDNNTRALQLVVGSTAVWDDRPKGAPYTASPENFLCRSPRLPIGHFVLDSAVSTIGDAFDMRVKLWDAEATGSLGGGAISWRVFAHAVYAEADVLAIELTQNTSTAAQAAAAATVSWRFVPASFNRPWAQRACVRDPNFKWNPPARNANVQPDGATVVTQMPQPPQDPQPQQNAQPPQKCASATQCSAVTNFSVATKCAAVRISSSRSATT